jgi:serine/threonine protein kinase
MVVASLYVDLNLNLASQYRFQPLKDIYKGELDGETVCVKVLRIFMNEFEREKLFKVSVTNISLLPCYQTLCYLAFAVSQDIAREVLLWKELDHPNILPFLGVDMTLRHPSCCLVSPWMKNGSVLAFIKAHPDSDRLSLVCVRPGKRSHHKSHLLSFSFVMFWKVSAIYTV